VVTSRQFHTPVFDCVSFSGRNICLDIAEAERDPETGFLTSRHIGPSVSLPDPISAIILGVLKKTFLGTRKITLDAQEGYLFSSRGEAEFDQKINRFPVPKRAGNVVQLETQLPPTQSLSNWSLNIISDTYGCHVEIKARLFGATPPAAWQKNHGNFWPEGDEAWLEARFHIDAVTQTVAFGRTLADSVREGSENLGRKPVAGSGRTSHDLQLANAAFGYSGALFGFTSGGYWVSISEREFMGRLSLEANRTVNIHSNGFVTAPYAWPRLSLTHLRFNDIADMLSERDLPFHVEFSNGDIGRLDGGRDFYENQPRDNPAHQYLKRARYTFDVRSSGLIFSYHLLVNDVHVSQSGPHTSGWMADTITIPWEVIVCRFPKLLRLHAHRAQASATGSAEAPAPTAKNAPAEVQNSLPSSGREPRLPIPPKDTRRMPDQTHGVREFVDNPAAPVLFSGGVSGFFIHEGVVTITFEVAAPQHTLPPGLARRTVIGRLVMPIPASQRLALSLIDFLKKQGFDPVPAAPAVAPAAPAVAPARAVAPAGDAAHLHETRPAREFVDDAGAPVIFSSAISGFFIQEGVVMTTFEVAAPQHTSPPGPARRIVIGRLAMPIPATQRLAVSLIDFLKKQGFDPVAAATAGHTAQ
jgi:hypothetical protein